MTRAGERLLKGAEEALAYARGISRDETYRVHNPKAYQIEPTAVRKVSDINLTIDQHQIKPNGNTADALSDE